ncbi:NAD(P)-binding protein [Mycena pura]|uniref:NAD(P)-binding protein n=1 Tax=Mycena pura TaxID=153505 RepID=A0AAD6UNX8_9AGAR|nr:NAD(P)-binding protein [Mycena pura]
MDGAVLADGKYTPRVSRSLDSPGSKLLVAKGVEVVAGNLSDKESVQNAIRGSVAVFGITNFWEVSVAHRDSEGREEVRQGKNLVDAAKEEGVDSLPNATKESNGKFKQMYHWDNKAVIEVNLQASGVPYAVLLTGYFLENLWKIDALKKTARFGPEDMQCCTWISHDLGQAAVALLNNYADPRAGVLGGAFPVNSVRVTYPQFAAAIGRAIGKEVTFTPLKTSGTEELDEMYTFEAKLGMYNDTPVPNPKLVALGVKFGTLEEFIAAEVVPRYA